VVPCQHNITSCGVNRRLRAGILLFTSGLVLGVLLVRADAPVLWRLTVFLPFMVSSTFVFQALNRTCLARAMSGERETASGVERVANTEQLQKDRKKARRTVEQALLTAAAGTLLFFLIP